MRTPRNYKTTAYIFDRNAGTYTAADIKRAAWKLYAYGIHNFMYSTYSDVTISRLDQRYKFNREAEAAAREIVKAKGFAGIKADREKYRARRTAQAEEYRRPLNVLYLPIVRDYQKNKIYLRAILPDRLAFFGRNHWAKDDRDRRALAILAAHFNK